MAAVVEVQHDQREHVACGVGSEQGRPRLQSLVGEVGDQRGVVEGVFHGTVGDAVFAGR